MVGTLPGGRGFAGAIVRSHREGYLRAAAAFSLGITAGVAGTLALAPANLSANDAARFLGLIRQDPMRARIELPIEARHRATKSDFHAPAKLAHSRTQSFAPLTAPNRAASQTLELASAPTPEPIRIIDRTGAESPLSFWYGGRGATRTVCVRLCDGFYFPIGNLNSSSDLQTHESMCQASCPAAPAAIFTLGPEGSIEHAVSRSMRSYDTLPVAFSFLKRRNASCVCQHHNDQSRVSALRDVTLRAGDAVVTGESAQVFDGASAFPYQPSDFTDFRATRQLSRSQQDKMDSLLGVTYAQNLLKSSGVSRVDAPPAGVTEIVRTAPPVETPRKDAPEATRTFGIVVLKPPQQPIRVVENRPAPGFVSR
ncbi:MAG: DUF2865 domain-containing protein [Beijerinckiaceae bacterium]